MRRTRPENDNGGDLLAYTAIGDAYNCGPGDSRMRTEDPLYFARRDVLSAFDNEILLAISDEAVAVLIEIADVARAGLTARSGLS